MLFDVYAEDLGEFAGGTKTVWYVEIERWPHEDFFFELRIEVGRFHVHPVEFHDKGEDSAQG